MLNNSLEHRVDEHDLKSSVLYCLNGINSDLGPSELIAFCILHTTSQSQQKYSFVEHLYLHMRPTCVFELCYVQPAPRNRWVTVFHKWGLL